MLVTLYARRGKFWIRYRHRGKEVRQSVARLLDLPPRAITEKLAEKARASRERELLTGRFPGAKEERLTIAQLLADYVAAARLRGVKCPQVIEARCVPLREAFGHLRAVDLTTPMLREYLTQRLAAGFAPGTISQGEIGAIRAAYRQAHRESRIQQLPHFPTLKVDNARQGFVDPEDFHVLAAKLPELHRDVATFAYLTARRIQDEVLNLPWAWVDLRGGEIRWPMTKNGRALTLPISSTVREILERRRKVVPLCAWVFHATGFSRPLSHTSFATQLDKAAPGMVPHDLRRSGVRNLMRAYHSETIAMSISGHRSREVFDRYNISSREDQRKALDAVESYVRKA